jgi:hypothetical protein
MLIYLWLSSRYFMMILYNELNDVYIFIALLRNEEKYPIYQVGFSIAWVKQCQRICH